jgi:phosphatidylserine decarboxylase
MNDNAFMTLMRLLPKSTLSHVVGHLTRAPVPPTVHQAAMRLFAKQYNVNLSEAAEPIESFDTFSAFFTRRLKDGERPIDNAKESIVSPCDGKISQMGTIESGRCLQAKGIWFSVDQLLDDARGALDFEQGSFVTIYLSPRDYHRFHCPVDAQVTGYTYLPGEFWPVNPSSVRTKDALFALNERLVIHLQSSLGKIAYIAVGATCVSRIQAAFDNVTTHTGGKRAHVSYASKIDLKKGAELGMFEMGSTVIMLFEKNRMEFAKALGAETPLRLGQRIATVRP